MEIFESEAKKFETFFYSAEQEISRFEDEEKKFEVCVVNFLIYAKFC